MRILLLASAHNSLSQRVSVELAELGHEVSVELANDDDAMIEAALLFAPDLIVAPMLKKRIPRAVWERHTCLIVHPGIEGDRGPSSLDWAILNGESAWGVTIVQAVEEFDAGPVWASETFAMPPGATKSSLYRNEVTDAAIRALISSVRAFEKGQPPRRAVVGGRGISREVMRQPDRAIDWSAHTSGEVCRRIRASDSAPGVVDRIGGRDCWLYGAEEEDAPAHGRPGELLARRQGAVLRATVDGAVWIRSIKLEEGPLRGIKLPAALALGGLVDSLPETSIAIDAQSPARTHRDIRYEERGLAGYLHWDFPGGAMGTEDCHRLRRAFLHARSRPTRVIVLCGGRDFFCNGIQLNLIEASPDPAEESWRNINAIDDLVEEILRTDSHLVISALQANAGAGGAMMALAADVVFARSGVVLNPHYETMELSGSEYWTYTLPRRVGAERASELTAGCLPIGTSQACRIGLVDAAFGGTTASFLEEVSLRASALATDAPFRAWIQAKRTCRLQDEARRPLDDYRKEELSRMRRSFWGDRRSYHEARRRFVRKIPPTETPLRFARHRVQSSKSARRA